VAVEREARETGLVSVKRFLARALRRLRFEFFSGLSSRGERVDIDARTGLGSESLDLYQRNHIARYRFATSLLEPGAVVGDFACGTGYGSVILAERASHVYGCDRAERVITTIRRRYRDWNNVTFVCGDLLTAEGIPSVDAIVSFETIEHLDPSLVPALLARFARILKPGGLLVLSCPYRQRQTSASRRHHRTFDIDEARVEQWLAGAGLVLERFMYQNYETHNVVPSLDQKDFVIAVCRRGPVAGRTEPLGASGPVSPIRLGGAAFREGSFFENVGLFGGASLSELLVSIAANLLVPLVVAKTTYAGYRTALLYMGYAGLLHFGLLNGFYLDVLGRPLSAISWWRFRSVLRVLLITQVVALPAVGLLLWSYAPLWRFDAMSLLITVVGLGTANAATAYSYLWQGTGVFRPLASSTVGARLIGLGALALVLWWRPRSLPLLIVAAVLPSFAMWRLNAAFASRARLARSTNAPGVGADLDLHQLWSRGRALYAANALLALLFTVDNLTVAVTFVPAQFASYAFAYGLSTLSYLGVNALTAAAAHALARKGREPERPPDRSALAYVAAIWGMPLTYWVGGAAARRYFPGFTDVDALLFLFCLALPFGTLLRSRVVATDSAAGREAGTARVALMSLVLVVAAIAACGLLEPTPVGIATGWTAGLIGSTTVAMLLRNRTSRVHEHAGRLLAHAACAAIALLLLSRVSWWWGGGAAFAVAAAAIIAFEWRKGRLLPRRKAEGGRV
jgi:SAM-dependent methyltransferase